MAVAVKVIATSDRKTKAQLLADELAEAREDMAILQAGLSTSTDEKNVLAKEVASLMSELEAVQNEASLAQARHAALRAEAAAAAGEGGEGGEVCASI